MQAGALFFVQADCTRLAGISEFITVSLLARKFNLPVVPHVGDMGQIHQHLVLFNHIALGHEALLLEYIPHMRDYFIQPAFVENGVYKTPQDPGSSSDMMETKESSMSEEKFLVTGAMGCIGAWVVRNLVQKGVNTIIFDLSTNKHRLELIMSGSELSEVALY